MKAGPATAALTTTTVCAAKLFGYGTTRGVDAARMANAGGFSTEDLAYPERRIPLDGVLSLWELLLRELRDPAIPIRIAQATTIDHLGIMGLAILTAADGNDRLERAVRYGRLFTEAGTWQTDVRGRVVTVRWLPAAGGRLGGRAATECAVGEFVRSMRLLVKRPFELTRAFFAHAGPVDRQAHDEFFACRLDFDAPVTGFCFDSGVLDFVASTDVLPLSTFVVGHAERMLAALDAGASLEVRLRRSISLELSGGSISLAGVARRHGVSERTLRRQLALESLSFRNLVDAVRSETATTLLRQDSLTLKEVAFLLGFSEPSAFSRAHKRWTGSSPRASLRDTR